MEKREIIDLIKTHLSQGTISAEDLQHLARVHEGEAESDAKAADGAQGETSSDGLTNVFYGIGALIAVIGVGILLAQNWEAIGFAGRILASLGISLIAYISAFLLKGAEHRIISQVLFTVSAALAPLGIYVLLQQVGVSFNAPAQFAATLVLTIIFATALYVSRRNILVLLTIGFASWAYWTFIVQHIASDSYLYSSVILRWASMLLGVSYLSIAYGYRSIVSPQDERDAKEKKAIRGVLCGVGTIALLAPAVTFGGVFDILAIALIFGVFYGSVYLKSRIMLILAALFLIAHIGKLTALYFAGSIGWPVALIFIGLLVIGVGYSTYQLNKKYFSKA